jgi:hypothetical protein
MIILILFQINLTDILPRLCWSGFLTTAASVIQSGLKDLNAPDRVPIGFAAKPPVVSRTRAETRG